MFMCAFAHMCRCSQSWLRCIFVCVCVCRRSCTSTCLCVRTECMRGLFCFSPPHRRRSPTWHSVVAMHSCSAVRLRVSCPCACFLYMDKLTLHRLDPLPSAEAGPPPASRLVRRGIGPPEQVSDFRQALGLGDDICWVAVAADCANFRCRRSASWTPQRRLATELRVAGLARSRLARGGPRGGAVDTHLGPHRPPEISASAASRPAPRLEQERSTAPLSMWRPSLGLELQLLATMPPTVNMCLRLCPACSRRILSSPHLRMHGSPRLAMLPFQLAASTSAWSGGARQPLDLRKVSGRRPRHPMACLLDVV